MLSKQGAARALAVIVLAVAAASLAGRASAVAPAERLVRRGSRAQRPLGRCSGTNKDATKEPGEPNHADEPGGASVWFHWTAPASGETTIDDLRERVRHAARRIYGRCGERSDRGREQRRRLRPSAARSRSSADQGETYRIAVDGVDGETGLFNLQLRLAPPNDDFADAVVISGDVGSVDGTNDGASLEESEPGDVSNSVWYRWTAPSTGPATFTTCGATASTRRSPCTPDRTLRLCAYVTSSGDECQDLGIAAFEATAGTTYSVAVGGCCTVSLATSRSPGTGTRRRPYALDYPSISGVAREGQTLTGSPGQWIGSPTFAYAWWTLRCAGRRLRA